MERTPLAPPKAGLTRVDRGMQYAYMEMLSPGMIRLAFTMLGLAVALFAIFGPIGTYITLTPLERLTYGVCAVFNWPICYAVSVVTAYLTRFRSSFQVGLMVAVASLVAAVPSAATVYTFQDLFFPQQATEVGFETLYAFVAPATVICHVLFHYALCQRLQLAAARDGQGFGDRATTLHGSREIDTTGSSEHLLDRPSAESPKAASTGGPRVPMRMLPATSREDTRNAEPAKAIIEGLPIEIVDDLVYLKSEGRYVHLYTSTDAVRVKARFADMVTALGDLGVQVHRSYWVAARHAEELVKRDSQSMLRLDDGHEIPVSRTYLVAARTALARSKPPS